MKDKGNLRNKINRLKEENLLLLSKSEKLLNRNKDLLKQMNKMGVELKILKEKMMSCNVE